uniref:Uncharacterized protein n=1 Tax=Chenopodium quinoa TaxID=63459 RepID=A0A803MVB3_CHEQI
MEQTSGELSAASGTACNPHRWWSRGWNLMEVERLLFQCESGVLVAGAVRCLESQCLKVEQGFALVMDEERILKIHYCGNCVDLTIDDVDKCLLINVINDMCEEFANRGFELPEYPGLHYCYNEKAFNLVDDGTMMKMFGTMQSKEIDLWASTSATMPDFATGSTFAIGSPLVAEPSSACPEPPFTSPNEAGPSNSSISKPGSSKPGTFKSGPPKHFRPKLTTWKNIKPTQVEHPCSGLRTLSIVEPVRRSPRLTNSLSPQKFTPSFSQPRRLPRMLEEISPHSPPHITLGDGDFFHPSNSESQILSPAPRRSPRLLQANPSPSLSQAPLRPPQINQNESPSEPTRKTRTCQSRVLLFLHGKKLPNSTARLKGVFVPHSQSSQTTPEGGSGRSAAGLGAVKWFKEVGPLDRWTRWKFDPRLSSDENTNNFVESFNNTIGVDSSYPILTLLEGIRRIAMKCNFGFISPQCFKTLHITFIHPLEKPQSLHLKNAFLGLRVVVEIFNFASFGGLQKHRGLKNCKEHDKLEGNEQRELDMASCFN